MTRLYPLEPLAEAMGCSLAEVGRRLCVSGSTWKQYRDHGVSELVADRLATRAGLHAAVIWPEWMNDQIERSMRECPECGQRFFPVNRRHTFCRTTCGNRARSRKRYRRLYATDPAFAEAERQRRRAMYEACGEYERARQRRYNARRRGRAA